MSARSGFGVCACGAPATCRSNSMPSCEHCARLDWLVHEWHLRYETLYRRNEEAVTEQISAKRLRDRERYRLNREKILTRARERYKAKVAK